MKARTPTLLRFVLPALFVLVLPEGGALPAREVFDDFAADPDPWDSDPVSWRSAPCCPGDAPPGGCEGIDGLALLNSTSGTLYGLFTLEAFSGDVRVHERVSFCGTTGIWDASLHTDPVQITGYLGGMGFAFNQWWFAIGKWVNGMRVKQVEHPVGQEFRNGVYELELQSIGDDLELRIWPEGSERPPQAQVSMRDPDFRSGSAGFAYLRDGGTERGVISWIRITELAPFFLHGDANDDGSVDLSDAIAILFALFTAQPLSCQKGADANDDGAVDLSDAVFLLGYLFLGERAPEARLGTCWTDPTPDELTCESSGGCDRAMGEARVR